MNDAEFAKFGFNSKEEMREYIYLIIGIYEDFVREYISRIEKMDDEQFSAF